MGRIIDIVGSRYFVWLVLYSPLVLLLLAFQGGRLFYGEMLHVSGEWSARLMMLALAVTPLRMMFPDLPVLRWLLGQRRYLGVAAFSYAALHTGVYLDRERDAAVLLEDAMTFAYWTGWLALVIFLLLAATSNNLAARAMRGAWKRLHRWVYVAAILLFAHWIVIAFDPIPGIAHLSVIAALEAYRVYHTRVSPAS